MEINMFYEKEVLISKKNIHILTLCLIALPYHCHANDIELKIPRAFSDSADLPSYFPEQALSLALQKTQKDYGKVELSYVDDFYSADRLRAMLVQNNGLDVMWSNATKEREDAMLSIKFNILRGINEYRLLMVKRGNANIFKYVINKDDLQLFKVGMGKYWADKKVFETNGIDITSTPTVDSMFKMLAAGRVDYLTRSIHEIDYELTQYKAYQFESEKNIMLHYCLPLHYYVRKDNIELAERISKGIKLAIADGTLDHLYWSTSAIKQAQKYLFNKRRRIIELPVSGCIEEANW